jgi:hypothetical protein
MYEPQCIKTECLKSKQEKYNVLISNITNYILNLKFIFGRQSGYLQVFILKTHYLKTECLKS